MTLDVNLYNDKPRMDVYYQVWIYTGRHWVIKDGCEQMMFKPVYKDVKHWTKIVKIEQISYVCEEIHG